ncbi:MAG: ABC transporter permease [Deltaproteobacteria bacterium]|nr:ABC transporter permease [Deltaproteobacteria bacterium]
MNEKNKPLMSAYGFLPVLGFIGVWEIVTRLGLVSQSMLPPFTTVVAEAVEMGWKEAAHTTFSPIVSFLYPIPALGWLPIFMIWFGVGELLPIAIIFTCSFFPVLYNTASGVRNVDQNYIQVARTLGHSEGRILLTILFPLALPSIFTGLRLEAGMAWRVIIAAEMVAIPTGIGALLMRAESLIRMDIIIVCLMVLAVMCFSFERFFYFLERKTTGRWRLG